ncbi:MAG: hypothetical protein KC910_13040 [Candidatus Eremiobacteraeota bacterium]|nr:hypothetical protein [Candidatus Eremiobacteraeota bacterium]
MEEPSELDRFLTHQQGRGELDSQGAFTLETRAALRKLARSSLPFAGAWAVKLVQAAVAAGASRLEFSHHRAETRVEFVAQLEVEPELAALEAAFFDPASEPGHLLMGLWSVGLGDGRAFALTIDGKTLLWDGRQLSRCIPRQAVKGVRLTVSHRAHDQQGFAPGLATRRKSEQTDSLRERAFTAPLQLVVDKQRLDGLAHCPSHGYTSTSHPLALTLSRADLPPLRLSRGSLEQTPPSGALPLELPAWPASGETGVAWLMTAHFGRNDHGMFQTVRQRCLLYWVQDGVVTTRDDLPQPVDCVSVALFVSAQGLATDISGFGLLENLDKADRVQAARTAVARDLGQLPLLNLEVMVRRARRAGWTALGLFLIGGATLAMLHPSLVFVAVSMGTVFKAGHGSHETRLESELRGAQERLVRSWPG